MKARSQWCWLLAFLASNLACASELPQRIVSLDYCADQYVMRMLPADRVLAVSPDAGKHFSYMHEQASDYATVRATAEDVLVMNPDLVVRSYGGGPQATVFFERANIPVLQVPYAGDLQGIRESTLAMAKGLGVAMVGEKIVAEFDRRLSRVQETSNGGRVLYMTPTGVTSGPGTLIHEMILAAGFENFEQRPGWHSIPLERLAYEQPDLVAAAFFEARAKPPALWSAMRHPVAQRQMAEQPTVLLHGAWTSCGAWFLMDAIEALANTPLRDAGP